MTELDDQARSPDPRSLLFAGGEDAFGRVLPMSRAALIDRTERWPMSDTTPTDIAGLLGRSRQLFVDGLYTYENFADAVMKSLQAAEAALAALLVDSKPNFARMINTARKRGLLTEEEKDRIDAGRELRNRLVHAKSVVVWTPALAADTIAASHAVVARLFGDTPELSD